MVCRLLLGLLGLCVIALPSQTRGAEKLEKLGGLCFASVRDNESPALQIHPLPSAIEEEVAFASKITKAIRTYTVAGANYLIPEFCNNHGVDCMVGAWIGPSRWRNDAEIELLIHLASQNNKRIKAVIVGNEVFHRGDCTEAQLIAYVRQVKAAVKSPVAVADTWRAWLEHPKVAAEVDICAVQIYPFWEGLSVKGAAQYTVRRVREVQSRYPDKRVVLTEFGWPSGGGRRGQAEANPQNATRYLREVIPLLDQSKIEYYYFALWDEKWKVGPEGDVGAHWGLFRSDGAAKPGIGELLPQEARKGLRRPPREITFRLAVDQPRNKELTEIVLRGPQAAGDKHRVAERGPGLETARERKLTSPYSGLRPIKRPEKRQKKDQKDNSRSPTKTKDRGGAQARESRLGAPNSPASDFLQAALAQRPPSRAKSPVPQRLDGICLSLFRDNETPHEGIIPLLSEIRADVFCAKKVARAVRTYPVTDTFSFVPEVCSEIGVDCFPGAALGKYPWLNDLEMEMLIRIGNSGNSRVKAVIVGNEVMHRGDFSLKQYIQYIRRVKRAVTVPVATAELLHSWLEHPELAAEVDILGVQIYPYWGGLTIEKAAVHTIESVQQLQRRYPGKRVILTEFGWPTAGGTIGNAAASAENAARYVSEVVPLLSKNRIKYLYFAMSDEKWKQRDEGGPGPHWGLLLSDGRVKPSFRYFLPPSAAAGMRRPPRKLSFED